MKEKLEKLKVYIDLVLDFLAFKKAKENLTTESTTTKNTPTTNLVSKIKNIFKK